MRLNESERLKKYNNEDDLLKVSEEIGDKIMFRDYDQEQIICLVNELININLLTISYTIREQILDVLCDATSYYNICGKVNLNSITNVKDKLEDDLKEYVDELIENVTRL